MLNKDSDVVPEQAPLIILCSKPAIWMADNGKYTKHTIQISRKMHILLNGKWWNFHKKVWCEGGLKLAYIVTTNVKEDKLNPILGYSMVRLDNWQRTLKNNVLWMTWLD